MEETFLVEAGVLYKLDYSFFSGSSSGVLE